MQHNQIIKTLERLIPDGVKNGPETTLLKYANDENLAPAQLERLGQMYNVAMTLNFMDKSANRGDTFQVIDTSSLLSKFTDSEDDTKEAHVPSDWGSWFEDAPNMDKAASSFKEASTADDFLAMARGEKDDSELVYNEAYEEYANATTEGFWDSLHKEATAAFELDSVNQMIADAEEDFRKVAGIIKDKLREGADFTEMFVEAASMQGEVGVKSASAVGAYLASTGLVPEGFQSEKRVRIIKDTWSTGELFKEASSALSKIQAAKDYKDFFDKEAAGNATLKTVPHEVPPYHKRVRNKMDKKEERERKNKPSGDSKEKNENKEIETDAPNKKNKPTEGASLTGNPTDANPTEGGEDRNNNSTKNKSEDKPSGKSEGGNSNNNSSLDTIMGLGGDATKSLGQLASPETYTGGINFEQQLAQLKSLSGGKNTAQQSVDEAVSGEAGVSTLQRLMMTDPIISKADPKMVVELTNTLAKASPQVREDPNLLRMALRESIQYEAIPIHTFKDLMEMEERSQKVQKTKGENEAKRYDI